MAKAKKPRKTRFVPGWETVAEGDFVAAMGGNGPGLFCVSLVFGHDLLPMLVAMRSGDDEASYLLTATTETLRQIAREGRTEQGVLCLFCDHRFRSTDTLGCVALITPHHKAEISAAMCAAVCERCVNPRETLTQRLMARYGELKVMREIRVVPSAITPGHA